jgi:hypothetical protein
MKAEFLMEIQLVRQPPRASSVYEFLPMTPPI